MLGVILNVVGIVSTVIYTVWLAKYIAHKRRRHRLQDGDWIRHLALELAMDAARDWPTSQSTLIWEERVDRLALGFTIVLEEETRK